MDAYFQKVAKNAQVRADLRASRHVLSAQTSHAQYHYKPLQHEGEIRLIKFVNFSSDKPVIELDHVHVDQVLHYRALSYTWGNESYTSQYLNPETNKYERQNPKDVVLVRTIDSLSQKRVLGFLSVTKNCAEALWRLYADNPHVPVWIDAICIDQDNIQERNHQIGLMEIIYRGATKVQVYIGADDTESHSDEAMKYLERNFRSILKGHGNPFENFGYVDVLPRRVVDAIAALLRRQWFARVWVLQEVQSAKYAEIICGKYKIPWLALRIVAPGFYNTTSSAKLPPILDIAEGGLRSKDLLTLLRETRSLHATDPRDKVYAMLTLAYNVSHSTPEPDVEEPYVMHQMYSYQLLDWLLFLVHLNLMSSDDILPVNVMVENVRKVLKLEEQRKKRIVTESQKAIRYDIIPDYSSSIYSIYSELARRTINSSKNLNIFDEIRYNAEGDLPSWVPDWSMENKRITLSQEAGEDFSASGESKFAVSEDIAGPLELIARGKLLGRVEYSNYSNIPTKSSSESIRYYDPTPMRHPLFEISQRITGLVVPTEEWTRELSDDVVSAYITDWVAKIFSQAESLAVLRMMLNVGVMEQTRPSQERISVFRSDFEYKKRGQSWLDRLERRLPRYDTAYVFQTANGSGRYHSIEAIDAPQPKNFKSLDTWLESLRQKYAEELLKLKMDIDEGKNQYMHLLKRLEIDTFNFLPPDLPQFFPTRESIWLQKRDLPADGPNPEYSMFAVVEDKLFSLNDTEYSPDSDEDYRAFQSSRFRHRRGNELSFNDRDSLRRTVAEVEPELESRLGFLKEVLYSTVLWMNELKKFPEKLRSLDPRISKDRVLFTAGDYKGTGSEAVECGDLVCVLLGGRVPYILRPIGGEEAKEATKGVPEAEGQPDTSSAAPMSTGEGPPDPIAATPMSTADGLADTGSAVPLPMVEELPPTVAAGPMTMKERLFPSVPSVKFCIISECYVEGIMHGEAMTETEDPDLDFEWLTLV